MVIPLVSLTQIRIIEQIAAVQKKLGAADHRKTVDFLPVGAVFQIPFDKVPAHFRQGIYILCQILQTAGVQKVLEPGAVVEVDIVDRGIPVRILLDRCEQVMEFHDIKMKP